MNHDEIDVDMAAYNRGLEAFIKEAGLNEKQAEVVRHGSAEVKPDDFLKWLNHFIDKTPAPSQE